MSVQMCKISLSTVPVPRPFIIVLPSGRLQTRFSAQKPTTTPFSNPFQLALGQHRHVDSWHAIYNEKFPLAHFGLRGSPIPIFSRFVFILYLENHIFKQINAIIAANELLVEAKFACRSRN